MVHVKVCGVTRLVDGEACVDAGVSAVGLNFVPASPRHVDVATARAIARAIRARVGGGRTVQIVGVVADQSLEEMRRLREDAELDCLQLHGDEPDDVLAALLPHAYKAVRIAAPADVERARRTPGDHVLVDAKVDGALGGTGHAFDWELVRALAKVRNVTLAGGLTPANVRRAVALVAPFCVDVASGVESAPGVKDEGAVRAFVREARG